MPTLELNATELIVRLSVLEKILSVHGDLRIPLAQVRGATEDGGFHREPLGMRVPGTRIPGLLKAGTFLTSSDRQFVYLRASLQPLVIELSGAGYSRLALGLPDARAAAQRINAAIAGHGAAPMDRQAIEAQNAANGRRFRRWVMVTAAIVVLASVLAAVSITA